MRSPLLRPLLQEVWNEPTFGGEAFAPMDEAAATQQMEEVLDGFATEMRHFLSAGLPDKSDRERDLLLRGLAAKTIAFSSNLAAGEGVATGKLVDMGVLTALTGIGNSLLDYRDPAMPPAIRRLCGETAPIPDGTDSVQVAARHRMLGGITVKSRHIAPDDAAFKVIDEVVRKDLMMRELRAHLWSMEYLETADRTAFLQQNGHQIAENLLVTAALQTAVVPVYGGLYWLRHSQAPHVREVYRHPAAKALIRRANGIVRAEDDWGDRHKDRRPESVSLNVWNQPELAVPFCRHIGITDKSQLRELSDLFASPPSRQQADAVTRIFAGHFYSQLEELPSELAAFGKFVRRALAAGIVNGKLGDDALIDPGGQTP